MGFVKQHHSPFLLLLILTSLSSSRSEIIPITIKISNQIAKRLVVSCKLDGVDIGTYKVKPAGVWSYVDQVNPALGSGRFECDLNSEPRNGHFVLFDYYRDLQRCSFAKLCFWAVRLDGLYLFYDHQFNFVSSW